MLTSISSTVGETACCREGGRGPSGRHPHLAAKGSAGLSRVASSAWGRCSQLIASALLAAALPALLSCGGGRGQEELNRGLLTAVIEGNTGEAKQLLERGAEIDARDEKGMTALHLAVGNSHAVTLEFLVRSGADVNAQDAHGWTALHLATFLNDTRLMTILLDGGADLFIRDEDGKTPLDIAALYQRKEAAVLLLERGGMVPSEAPPGSV